MHCKIQIEIQKESESIVPLHRMHFTPCPGGKTPSFCGLLTQYQTLLDDLLTFGGTDPIA